MCLSLDDFNPVPPFNAVILGMMFVYDMIYQGLTSGDDVLPPNTWCLNRKTFDWQLYDGKDTRYRAKITVTAYLTSELHLCYSMQGYLGTVCHPAVIVI